MKEKQGMQHREEVWKVDRYVVYMELDQGEFL